MKLMDGAYPILTRFSKHLLEKQGLIAYSNFEEIYALIDEYLDQDY